jgi:hypothetical protein
MSGLGRSIGRKHEREAVFDDRIRDREQDASAGRFGFNLYRFVVSVANAFRYSGPQQLNISAGNPAPRQLRGAKDVAVPSSQIVIDVTPGNASHVIHEPVNAPSASAALITIEQSPPTAQGNAIEVVNGRAVQVARPPEKENAPNALAIAARRDAEKYFVAMVNSGIQYIKRVSRREKIDESTRWAMYEHTRKRYRPFNALIAKQIVGDMKRALNAASGFVRESYFTARNGWKRQEPEAVEPKRNNATLVSGSRRELPGAKNDQ